MWWTSPPHPPRDTWKGLGRTTLQRANNSSPSLMPIRPESIEFREMKSYAPTPSTDTTVALSSRSVNASRTCDTHSHPALVSCACRKGAVSSLACSANCFANAPHPVFGFLQCGNASQAQQTVRQLSQQPRIFFTFEEALEMLANISCSESSWARRDHALGSCQQRSHS